MFQNWGFLLTEIWVLLALAALLGLLVGWLIWGREAAVAADTAANTAAVSSEADGLRAALANCKTRGDAAVAKAAALEAELSDTKARLASGNAAADAVTTEAVPTETAAASAGKSAAPAVMSVPEVKAWAIEKVAPAAPAPLMSAPEVKAAAVEKVEPAAASAAPTAAAKGTKPKGLTEARGGKADDLKLIKGIGPALEKLCNKLGFFHFDQIAAWTAKEIDWVDDNLEGFKGRVTRDEWVAQARALAKG